MFQAAAASKLAWLSCVCQPSTTLRGVDVFYVGTTSFIVMCLKELVCLLAPTTAPSQHVSPCLPDLFVLCMFQAAASSIKACGCLVFASLFY
jgi:hypothetical protein